MQEAVDQLPDDQAPGAGRHPRERVSSGIDLRARCGRERQGDAGTRRRPAPLQRASPVRYTSGWLTDRPYPQRHMASHGGGNDEVAGHEGRCGTVAAWQEARPLCAAPGQVKKPPVPCHADVKESLSANSFEDRRIIVSTKFIVKMTRTIMPTFLTCPIVQAFPALRVLSMPARDIWPAGWFRRHGTAAVVYIDTACTSLVPSGLNPVPLPVPDATPMLWRWVATTPAGPEGGLYEQSHQLAREVCRDARPRGPLRGGPAADQGE